ncbi:MAG: matrixin family metalloprotease [Kofleriaceae bacterium]
MSAPALPSTGPSAFVDAAPACEPERRYCFSIHLHVADGVVDPAWIGTQVAVANHHFTEVDASFKIVKVDAKTMERIDTIADRASLKKYVTGRTIHVFVTNRLQDVDVADDEIRGVALKKGDTKYVILSAIAPDRVLAHELGHVFGLKHSTYPISIMNKTERLEPPIEDRTFAPEEIVTLKATAKRLVRARILSAR